MRRQVAVSHFPGEHGDDCHPCHHLPVGAGDQRERHRMSGDAQLFLPSCPKSGGDGCSTCDLHEGAGTTLVDQMRPASGWRCRCSKFRSGEARNGTSFGIEQMSSIVWWRRGAGAGGATASPPRTFTLPFRHALCKDCLHDSTDQHHPPLQPRETAYATEN